MGNGGSHHSFHITYFQIQILNQETIVWKNPFLPEPNQAAIQDANSKKKYHKQFLFVRYSIHNQEISQILRQREKITCNKNPEIQCIHNHEIQRPRYSQNQLCDQPHPPAPRSDHVVRWRSKSTKPLGRQVRGESKPSGLDELQTIHVHLRLLTGAIVDKYIQFFTLGKAGFESPTEQCLG